MDNVADLEGVSFSKCDPTFTNHILDRADQY